MEARMNVTEATHMIGHMNWLWERICFSEGIGRQEGILYL